MSGQCERHPCAICGQRLIGLHFAACQPCRELLPAGMRTALAKAWKWRVADSRAYSETLIGVLVWARDKRPTLP